MNDPGDEEIAGELDDEALSRIKSELDPGKRLIWASRPREMEIRSS